MTTVQKEKIARRKLSLLQLELSKACRLMGYSRQQFYEIRRKYQSTRLRTHRPCTYGTKKNHETKQESYRPARGERASP